MALRIRQHDRNPNLWWVSSPEDDVAYIARPGNHYRAWTTYGWKPAHANFVGIPFETIEEALASAETGNVENGRQESPRKGLFSIDDGFRSSGRLGGQ